MLKKLAIGSAALLLSCMLLVAMLGPVAIEQTVRMAESLSGQYEQMVLSNTIPAQGVKTVDLFRGIWMEELTLRPSPDENIYLYTEQYWEPGCELLYELDRETGHMSLRSYWYGASRNPWKLFTRENILKEIVRIFSGDKGMCAELWLPQGVAFNRSSRVRTLNNPDDLVETYARPPVWEEDSYQQEMEEKEAEEAAQAQLLQQQAAEQAQALQEYSNWMAQRYEQYEQGKLTDDAFLTNLSNTLEKAAAIIVTYDESERFLESEMEDFLLWTMKKNQLLLGRKNLYRSYENHIISKEEFYAQDLELDRRAEELESQRIPEESALYQAILTAEATLEVETDFGRILYGDED